MTIRITISNATSSPSAVLIDKGQAVHVALRPGESIEETIWAGSPPLKLTELEDATRKDVVWLTERATT
jgi:hypothetical protein